MQVPDSLPPLNGLPAWGHALAKAKSLPSMRVTATWRTPTLPTATRPGSTLAEPITFTNATDDLPD
jgi:hypothetical protein